MLVELRIPAPNPGSGGAYQKLERKVGDYAIAGVAAQIVVGADGLISEAGIALTNVGPMPIRATEAEDVADRPPPGREDDRRRGASRRDATDPVTDLRGPADYKRAVTRTLTARALRSAAERALA